MDLMATTQPTTQIYIYRERNKTYLVISRDSVMKLNPLSANPTKWSNTLKQFVELFECVLTTLWGWRLKG